MHTNSRDFYGRWYVVEGTKLLVSFECGIFEVPVMKNAEMGEVAADWPVRVASAGRSRTNINVWMIDNQPAYGQAVATALRRTADLIMGGYFVHPDDAILDAPGVRAPDIILIDLEQFGSGGFEAVRKLTAAFEGVPWIILTHSMAEESISNAVCAGASGYLLKDSCLEQIPESIRQAFRGGALLAPGVARSVLEMFRRMNGVPHDCGLTSRELRVLRLMGEGLLTKQIAQQLKISYHTVDTHSRNIYDKLGVHSRAGAVAKALRARLI